MQDQHPRKPFSLATNTQAKAQPKTNDIPTAHSTRDKDNAQPRVPPPKFAQVPAPNLAPPGMSGIKRSPLQQQVAQQPARPQFKAGNGGELSKEFKPIAERSPEKGHSHDR